MARKLRIEYDGAIYHVISRGNYRADVFGQEKTKAAFLECLSQACEKAGWVVHAWCIMSNHYHLCVETPQPNLVEGMRWLQATFSVRFNRLRNERGHVFQGRYKALLVDPLVSGAVCHYIHLNPVRARLCTVAELENWPWSSVRWVLNRKQRRAWFSAEQALAHAGGLADTRADAKRYLAYLDWLQCDENGQKQLQFERLSKDWAIGEAGFKKELLIAHKQLQQSVSRMDASARELAESLWDGALTACLSALGKGKREVKADAKGAPWKVAVACHMKTHTTAGNPWLAQRLNMGSPFRLSRLVTVCRASPRSYEPFLSACAKCKV